MTMAQGGVSGISPMSSSPSWRTSPILAQGPLRKFDPTRSYCSISKTCFRASKSEWRQRGKIGSLRSDRRWVSALPSAPVVPNLASGARARTRPITGLGSTPQSAYMDDAERPQAVVA